MDTKNHCQLVLQPFWRNGILLTVQKYHHAPIDRAGRRSSSGGYLAEMARRSNTLSSKSTVEYHANTKSWFSTTWQVKTDWLPVFANLGVKYFCGHGMDLRMTFESEASAVRLFGKSTTEIRFQKDVFDDALKKPIAGAITTKRASLSVLMAQPPLSNTPVRHRRL